MSLRIKNLEDLDKAVSEAEKICQALAEMYTSVV